MRSYTNCISGFAVVVAMLFPALAYGWGSKEHVNLTRLAVLRLLEDEETPGDMKAWLKQGQPGELSVEGERKFFLEHRMGMWPRGVDGLAFWSIVPDLDKRAEFELEGVKTSEYRVHYINVELFHSDESKRKYFHDLSGKPALKDIPRDAKDPRWQRAGMLPFRTVDVYNKLVRCIREGKLVDQAGQFPRDDHAVRWAGYLAHYVADNTNPHHGTIDYKSLSYLPNGQGPNIHAALEWMMGDSDDNDHMELRKAYFKAFVEALPKAKDPYAGKDVFTSTVQVALDAYDALPLIGEAGNAAMLNDEKIDLEKFFHFKGKVNGRQTTVLQVKARQQALAVARIASTWKQAWLEAKKPAAE